MKLKQGFLNADLVFRFSILHSDTSRIYNSWIVELSTVLKCFDNMARTRSLKKNLPNSFSKYKNCTTIIDFMGIYIEKSLNLQVRRLSLIIKTPTPSNT